MAFGQASGPPATNKQVDELVALIDAAGLGTLREARYRLDLTQRQASGKFTRDEASELIDRLTAGEIDRLNDVEAPTVRADPALADVASEVLALELERRGWACISPTPGDMPG